MIKTILFVAALATPASGSLKDPPSDNREAIRTFWEAIEEPSRPAVNLPDRAPYLLVLGEPGRLRVPAVVLRQHRLRPGQTISRDLARQILRTHYGARYSDEAIEELRQLDDAGKSPTQ